ncbi:hypothetical protein [Ilumatobacter coccineus]|uniref:Uncharacterized protein n=1 Tax=Ilumatobacter coccineus (strain NBRC 103263 / KCTC 29153 / YM16-304) TaxID=1313172 RepID=A0A6C7EHE1_ILUCY|nr:hypothetical protein [Ilumatobacter coccineus]BAN03396.1 hypothetical protein YM304_30820 [Ilumatobacter coccineus YM16-304]
MTVDLPPPVPDARTPRSGPPAVPYGVRPGDLTLTWRFVVMFGWMFAFFAYAAVWQASVQLGIATWWLGPRSQPTPLLIRMIPFFIVIVGGMAAVYNVRRLSHVSIGVALVSALVALPDFSRSVGLAVVELLISGSLVVLSVASLAGRYRLALAEPGANQMTGPAQGNGSDHVTEPDRVNEPAQANGVATGDAPSSSEAWARPAPPSSGSH